MPAHLIARCDEHGRWTLERDGTWFVGSPGVAEDELAERLEDLVILGWLEVSDRVVVDDRRRSAAYDLRRVEDLLPAGDPEPGELALAAVRAERYASEEHYV